MNSVLVISVFFICVATAASISKDTVADTIAYSNNNDGSGNYYFSFKTSNGISREESGEVRNSGQNNQFIFIRGFYTYTDPDGQEVKVNYIADDNGYQIVSSPDTAVPDKIPILGLPAGVTSTLLGG
ncbi:endocuticle structural glycoprotein SgAbd-5-like [Galleria mellonella]|uniref:Endocuticle structural glycoprotein SgAbd-5-like n=1 Tax=Galleria mellonella TaxID=7137 RepID=A0A6J1WDK4_GALME|nr:endocuticle structural glycoprotein SgAbd-5-like [Galleria mellonella]